LIKVKVESEVPKTRDRAVTYKYPAMTFQPSLLSLTQTAQITKEREFLKAMMKSRSCSTRLLRITFKPMARASKAEKLLKIQVNKKYSISGEVLRVSGLCLLKTSPLKNLDLTVLLAPNSLSRMPEKCQI